MLILFRASSLANPQRPPPRSTDEKWVHDAYEGNGGGRKPASFGSGAGAGAGPAMPVTQSPRIEVSGVHYEVTPEELKVSHWVAYLSMNLKLTDRACSSRRGLLSTAPTFG